MPAFAALLAEPAMLFAACGAALAGLVRGFAGFGAAMIYIPVAALALGPVPASATLFIIDGLSTLPLAARAARRVDFREIGPLAAGALLLVPAGAWTLGHVDPAAIRWFLSTTILIALAILVSGLRWRGDAGPATAAAVGGMSGFLSGLAQLGGPPVLVYWLGRAMPPAKIRANTIVLFFFSSMASGISYLLAGYFSADTLIRSLALLPVYAAGIATGSYLFRFAREALFRRLAYALIAFVAIAGLPLFDGWRP